MGAALDVVVTCTDRKALPPRLRVRDVPRGPDRTPEIREWLERLEAEPRTQPARTLYQGETWAASLELEQAARHHRGVDNVRLWVASAGYGLVSADEKLTPYAATFSPGAVDFVGGACTGGEGVEAARQWWRALTSAPVTGDLSSLTALAEEAPGDVIMVSSEAYLRACQSDVARAVATSDRVVLVCSSAHRSLRFGHASPAFDARLLTTAADRKAGRSRPILRGTRMSLNVRAARLLVECFGSGPIDRRAACRYLEELTAAQPALQRFEGDHHDDTSVRRFIASWMESARPASKTSALRAFRDAGNKCEQKRFGALYEQVQRQLYERESA